MSSLSAASPGIYYFPVTFTVAVGTPITAPASIGVNLGDAWLDHVEVKVPQGPHGVMGFHVVYNGRVIVPWGQQLGWLILDNDANRWDVGTEVDQHLTVEGYNIGAWPHNVYLRFAYVPMSAYRTGGPTVLNLGP